MVPVTRRFLSLLMVDKAVPNLLELSREVPVLSQVVSQLPFRSGWPRRAGSVSPGGP